MSIRPLRLLAALVLCATVASAAEPNDLEALQKKLLQQLLNGNPTPDELRQLVGEMNKLMGQQFPELQPFALPDLLFKELEPFRAVPRRAAPGFGGMGLVPFPPPRVFDRGDARPAADLPPGEVSDKRLKEFDEQIEKLKDNPEAQAELRKARDEYKKALEEGMRKGVERPREDRPAPQPAFPPPFRRVAPINIDVPILFDRPNLARPKGPVRLGVVFEKPSAILTEHLNLPADVGVVVVEVVPGSVADKAGLRTNDVVVKLGGKDAPSELSQFQQLVAELKSGEKIEAVLYRKGKKETVGGIELPAGGR